MTAFDPQNSSGCNRRTSRLRRVMAPVASCSLAMAILLTAAPSNAGQPLSSESHIPEAAANAQPIGRLDSASRLHLSIGLPLRNQASLTNLLDDLYDPRSPSFHQFLTPETFTAKFGPSQEDYAAVLEFAQTNHLTVTATHSNRVVMDVSGSVGDIEKAFHIRLMTYRHPAEAREFFAPDTEPTVDPRIPMLHVTGLDNFTLPHPAGLRKASPAAATTSLNGSGPSGSLMGADFRSAYAPGVALTGSGQTVGLLQFDGYYSGDITRYENLNHLPNVPLQNVYLDNFNGTPGSANSEVALDIEMTISMAPGLASVIIYQAGPYGYGNDILNRMATDNAARQLSSSWTFGTDSTTTQIFQQMAAQGQTFFNASGDFDAYTGKIPKPADNAYITIVGGTTLSTSAGGAWLGETVWNWGSDQGSSGGMSTTVALPAWQQGVANSANHGSTTRRNIPDVAMTADNIYIIADNGQGSYVGGTSCAAPLWAGFVAMVNQQLANNGHAPVGFVNPALYALGKGPLGASVFHDVSSGNNFNSISPTNFQAVAGYDLCTGWGSPAGAALINALAPAASPAVQPLAISQGRISGQNFVFTFPSVAGQSYTVEYKDSLNDGVWTRGTAVTATGSTTSVTNPMSTPQRFFRVGSP